MIGSWVLTSSPVEASLGVLTGEGVMMGRRVGEPVGAAVAVAVEVGVKVGSGTRVACGASVSNEVYQTWYEESGGPEIL